MLKFAVGMTACCVAGMTCLSGVDFSGSGRESHRQMKDIVECKIREEVEDLKERSI